MAYLGREAARAATGARVEEGWERRTKALTLSDEEVRTCVKAYAPQRPVLSHAKLEGGLVNANVHVRLGEPAEDVVLRVYLRDGAAASIEGAVLEAVVGRIPAPRQLASGRLGELPFALHSLVPGRALTTLFAGGDNASIGRAGTELGGALAALHAHQTEALGFLDANLRVPEPMPSLAQTWTEHIGERLAGAAGDRLGPALSERLRAHVKAHRDALEELGGSTSLLHADCKPTNIFVREDGGLTGLLDWEFAWSGPPIFDVGQLFRWPVPPIFEARFVSSYRVHGGVLGQDWRAAARLIDLLNLVQMLNDAGPREVVASDCRRLIEESL